MLFLRHFICRCLAVALVLLPVSPVRALEVEAATRPAEEGAAPPTREVASPLSRTLELGQATASRTLELGQATASRTLELGQATASKTLELGQTIYKGVVGNLLDRMPIEAKEKLDLQRANAVVGNTMSARSLAVLLGVGVPVLMVGGLIWGLYAASRIEPAKEVPHMSAISGQCGEEWMPVSLAEMLALEPATVAAAAEPATVTAAPEPALVVASAQPATVAVAPEPPIVVASSERLIVAASADEPAIVTAAPQPGPASAQPESPFPSGE